jgi:hypothetical protein
MEQLLSTATADMHVQQEQSVQTKQRVQLVNTTQLEQGLALVLPVQAEATAIKRNKLLAKLVSTATLQQPHQLLVFISHVQLEPSLQQLGPQVLAHALHALEVNHVLSLALLLQLTVAHLVTSVGQVQQARSHQE